MALFYFVLFLFYLKDKNGIILFYFVILTYGYATQQI